MKSAQLKCEREAAVTEFVQQGAQRSVVQAFICEWKEKALMGNVLCIFSSFVQEKEQQHQTLSPSVDAEQNTINTLLCCD